MYAPKSRDDALPEPGALLDTGEVGWEDLGAAADLLRQSGGGLPLIAVVDGDPRACFSHGAGNCRAYPPAGAGDEHLRVAEIDSHGALYAGYRRYYSCGGGPRCIDESLRFA